MRAQATSHRGWFGLIRKGSGQVAGLARLTDCGKALSPSEMIASHGHHRIPETMIRSGAVSKWVIPWKLADIRPLERPVPYEHKSGVVTWVLFSDEVAAQLAHALDGAVPHFHNDKTLPTRTTDAGRIMTISDRPAAEASMPKPMLSVPTQPLPDAPHHLLGRTRISGGNLRNNHFYIGKFLDRFPADMIGGSNKKAAAAREITVDWGGPSPVMTDIDQTKRMFRKRGWVGQFFAASGAREGDTVVVTSPAPYQVHIRVERRSTPDLSDP